MTGRDLVSALGDERIAITCHVVLGITVISASHFDVGCVGIWRLEIRNVDGVTSRRRIVLNQGKNTE